MSDQVKEVYALGYRTIDDIGYYYEMPKELEGFHSKIEVEESITDGGPYSWADYPPIHKPTWAGQRIKTEHLPKIAIKRGPKRQVEDFCFAYSLMLVSEAFRKVVELLEPNIHQFIPVEHVWTDGSSVTEKSYWFNVCTALDGVNEGLSEAKRKRVFNKNIGREVTTSYVDLDHSGKTYKVIFDLKVINDHHIWRDHYLNTSTIAPLCSGQFKDAYEQAGLIGCGFHHREAV